MRVIWQLIKDGMLPSIYAYISVASVQLGNHVVETGGKLNRYNHTLNKYSLKQIGSTLGGKNKCTYQQQRMPYPVF